MDKKVAICLSCYNHGRFVEEAIESIVNQTYDDWHLFFWDVGSTDNSKALVIDMIRSNINLREKISINTFDFLLFQKRPLPIGIARYLMVQKCFTDEFNYIAILDADDTWLPTKLEKQLEVFKSDPSFKLVFSDCNYLYWKDEIMQIDNYPAWTKERKDRKGPKTFHEKYPPLMGGNIFKNLLLNYNFMPCPTLMFEREGFLTCIESPMGYTSAEDYDWILKMTWFANMVGYVKEPLANYRIHEDQLTALTPVRCTMEEIDVVKRFGRFLSGTDRLRLKYRLFKLYLKLIYKELNET